jgi:hypothetical protein
MRYLVFPVLYFLILASCEKDETKEPKYRNIDAFLCDSVYYFRINPEGDSLLEGKLYNLWDEHGNSLSVSYYYKESLNEPFDGHYRTDNSYNESGAIVETVDYSWDFGRADWVPRSKISNSYTGKGRLNTQETIYYDITTGSIREHSREEFTYGLPGNHQKSITYRWNTSTGTWYEQRASDCKLDSKGQIVLSMDSWYDTITCIWKTDYKEEMTYDALGNQKTRLCSYLNEAGTWEVYYKWVRVFDGRGSLLSEVYYSRDYGTKDLLTRKSIQMGYNSEGRLITMDIYAPLLNIYSLVYCEHLEYVYDSDGNLLLVNTYNPGSGLIREKSAYYFNSIYKITTLGTDHEQKIILHNLQGKKTMPE